MGLRFFVISFLSLFAFELSAQNVFKVGEESFKASTILHQYLYNYVYKDSFKVTLMDSVVTYITADSSVTCSMNFPINDKVVYKTVCFFNRRKQLFKQIEYKNLAATKTIEYQYDEATGKKLKYFEEDKIGNKQIRQSFEYSNDKINGDLIVTIANYSNDKIEFYTKEYYDKTSKKYKEVRLNDNKKDIMHVESFYYNENGKLRSRSVYFTEFKVTKDYKEPNIDEPAKCFKNFALNVTERVTSANKVVFLKKFLAGNKNTLLDKDCKVFEYRYMSFPCEIILSNVKDRSNQQVILRIKERT